MFKKAMLLLVLLVIPSVFAVFAQPGNYEKFYLSQNLADALKMSDFQIDAVSEQLGTLSRHWNKAIVAIADIDEQIDLLQNNTQKSPVTIGGQAGILIQLRVETGRKIINEVVANFNGNLFFLTKEQVALVNGLEDKMNEAEKAYGMFYDANSANFILGNYRVSSLPYPYYPPPSSCGDCGGVMAQSTEALMVRLSNELSNDVAQLKQERSTERKSAAASANRESQRAKVLRQR